MIWVWPEMSYGFLHGIERLGAELGERWSREEPSRDWKIVHFFGYDNSFYHSILYPVLYQLAYPEWDPDIDYHVNEFYLLEGQKFSTSRRHAIWGKEILTPDTVDAVRYYLSRTRPEGERTDFRRAEFDRACADTLVGRWQDWLHDLGRASRRPLRRRGPRRGHLDRRAHRVPGPALAAARRDHRRAQPRGLLAAVRRGRARRRSSTTCGPSPASSPLWPGCDRWSSEARTAIALELAAARLLATASAPVLPRFSAKLAAALGIPAIDSWPDTADLVEPGSRSTLTDTALLQPRTSGDD